MIIYHQDAYHKIIETLESDYKLQSETGEIIVVPIDKCVPIQLSDFIENLRDVKAELEQANQDYADILEELPEMVKIQQRIAEAKEEKTQLEKDIRRIYAVEPTFDLPEGFSPSQKMVWEYDEKLMLNYLAKSHPEVLTINKTAFEKIVDEIPWEIAEQVRLRRIGHHTITIHK